MLVLDSSGSMSGQIHVLQSLTKRKIVDNLTTNRDRVGVVTFASGSVVQQPLQRTNQAGFDRAGVESAIDSLVAGGWTSTGDAIRKATDELLAVPPAAKSAYRAIVLFSDGAPNVFAFQSGERKVGISRNLTPYDPDQVSSGSGFADISVTMPTTALGNISTTGRLPVNVNTPMSSCEVLRASRNVAENAAQSARQQGIVIHVVGYGLSLNHLEQQLGDGCGFTEEDIGSALLRRIANVPNASNQNRWHVASEPTGTYCQAATESDLTQCFEKVSQDMQFQRY